MHARCCDSNTLRRPIWYPHMMKKKESGRSSDLTASEQESHPLCKNQKNVPSNSKMSGVWFQTGRSRWEMTSCLQVVEFRYPNDDTPAGRFCIFLKGFQASRHLHGCAGVTSLLTRQELRERGIKEVVIIEQICVAFKTVFTLSEPSHAIWSQGLCAPPSHTCTFQDRGYWRKCCYLTKTCWRLSVCVCVCELDSQCRQEMGQWDSHTQLISHPTLLRKTFFPSSFLFIFSIFCSPHTYPTCTVSILQVSRQPSRCVQVFPSSLNIP